MTWSSSPSVTDRIWAALPYALPTIFGLSYGQQLINDFPVLNFLRTPFLPLQRLYSNLEGVIPFFGLVLFFALILLVVRNPNISHFIRFNTMQAILLNIILALVGLLLSIFDVNALGPLVANTLSNVIFLGMVAAVGYSVVQTFRGEYAEIPTISQAAHMQVR